MRYLCALLLIAVPLLSPAFAGAQPMHSADTVEPMGEIGLGELLRLIQLYNAGGLHCAALPGDSEDGYLPGSEGDTSCAPHDSDYLPQDWVIVLSELLRLVQFYNTQVYSIACGTEDNFVALAGAGSPCPEGEGASEGDGEGVEGEIEGVGEGEGAAEGEGEGGVEGASEGTVDGEGETEGIAEGAADGEGAAEGEGQAEGTSEGDGEGQVEGVVEGTSEGVTEGEGEGDSEGAAEGSSEGTIEGAGDGEGDTEGVIEGAMEGEGEGSVEGEGEGEGGLEGEGEIEGVEEGEGEGTIEGEGEGEPCVPIAAPYARGQWNETFNDAVRGKGVPVEIYYPAVAEAFGAAMAGPACQQFPVVVLQHGYQTDISHYEYLRTTLPGRGYILVMIDTYNGIDFDFPDYGNDGAFMADTMQAEGADPGSLFFGKVSDKTALVGHSMGGGAIVYAAGESANVTTIIGLAPSAIDSNVITAAPQVSVPALILAASKDCIVPAGSHAKPIYNGLSSACKYYVEIVNGSHCAYSDNNPNICNIGQTLGCLGTSFMSTSAQRSLAMLFIEPWLDAQLMGDAAAQAAFLANADTQQSGGAITRLTACP